MKTISKLKRTTEIEDTLDFLNKIFGEIPAKRPGEH